MLQRAKNHKYPTGFGGLSRTVWVAATNDVSRVRDFTQGRIDAMAPSARVTVPTAVAELYHDFLRHVAQDPGSSVLRAVYREQGILTDAPVGSFMASSAVPALAPVSSDARLRYFVHRLLTKRPYVEQEDPPGRWIMRTDSTVDAPKREKNDQEALALWQDKAYLTEYLSYEEMELSGLLTVSSRTEFINEGGSNNNARQQITPDMYSEGVMIGQSGPRLDRTVFDSKYLLHTKDEVVTTPGDRTDALWSAMNEHVYGHLLTDERQAQKWGWSSLFYNSKTAFFNAAAYAARIAVTADTFVQAATHHADDVGQNALCDITGVGLVHGWAPRASEESMRHIYIMQFLQAFHALPRETRLRAVRFTTFDITSTDVTQLTGFRELFDDALPSITDEPGPLQDYNFEFVLRNGVRVLFRSSTKFALRDLRSPELFVAQYDVHPNAFPGNEYWRGAYNKGGSSRVAASFVAQLHSPYFNPALDRDALVLAHPYSNARVSSLEDAQRIMLQQVLQAARQGAPTVRAPPTTDPDPSMAGVIAKARDACLTQGAEETFEHRMCRIKYLVGVLRAQCQTRVELGPSSDEVDALTRDIQDKTAEIERLQAQLEARPDAGLVQQLQEQIRLLRRRLQELEAASAVAPLEPAVPARTAQRTQIQTLERDHDITSTALTQSITITASDFEAARRAESRQDTSQDTVDRIQMLKDMGVVDGGALQIPQSVTLQVRQVTAMLVEYTRAVQDSVLAAKVMALLRDDAVRHLRNAVDEVGRDQDLMTLVEVENALRSIRVDQDKALVDIATLNAVVTRARETVLGKSKVIVLLNEFEPGNDRVAAPTPDGKQVTIGGDTFGPFHKVQRLAQWNDDTQSAVNDIIEAWKSGRSVVLYGMGYSGSGKTTALTGTVDGVKSVTTELVRLPGAENLRLRAAYTAARQSSMHHIEDDVLQKKGSRSKQGSGSHTTVRYPRGTMTFEGIYNDLRRAGLIMATMNNPNSSRATTLYEYRTDDPTQPSLFIFDLPGQENVDALWEDLATRTRDDPVQVCLDALDVFDHADLDYMAEGYGMSAGWGAMFRLMNQVDEKSQLSKGKMNQVDEKSQLSKGQMIRNKLTSEINNTFKGLLTQGTLKLNMLGDKPGDEFKVDDSSPWRTGSGAMPTRISHSFLTPAISGRRIGDIAKQAGVKDKSDLFLTMIHLINVYARRILEQGAWANLFLDNIVRPAVQARPGQAVGGFSGIGQNRDTLFNVMQPSAKLVSDILYQGKLLRRPRVNVLLAVVRNVSTDSSQATYVKASKEVLAFAQSVTSERLSGGADLSLEEYLARYPNGEYPDPEDVNLDAGALEAVDSEADEYKGDTDIGALGIDYDAVSLHKQDGTMLKDKEEFTTDPAFPTYALRGADLLFMHKVSPKDRELSFTLIFKNGHLSKIHAMHGGQCLESGCTVKPCMGAVCAHSHPRGNRVSSSDLAVALSLHPVMGGKRRISLVIGPSGLFGYAPTQDLAEKWKGMSQEERDTLQQEWRTTGLAQQSNTQSGNMDQLHTYLRGHGWRLTYKPWKHIHPTDTLLFQVRRVTSLNTVTEHNIRRVMATLTPLEDYLAHIHRGPQLPCIPMVVETHDGQMRELRAAEHWEKGSNNVVAVPRSVIELGPVYAVAGEDGVRVMVCLPVMKKALDARALQEERSRTEHTVNAFLDALAHVANQPDEDFVQALRSILSVVDTGMYIGAEGLEDMMKRVAVVQSIRMHYELLPAFMSLVQDTNTEFTFYLPLMDAGMKDWHYWLTAFQKMPLPTLKDFSDLQYVAPGEYDVFILPTDDDRINKVCRTKGPVVTLNHSPKLRFEADLSFNIRPFPSAERTLDTTIPCFVPHESLKRSRTIQPIATHVKTPPGDIDAKFCKQVLIVGLSDGRDIDVPAMAAMLNNIKVQVTILTRSALQIQRIFSAGDMGLTPIYIPEAPAHVMFDLIHRADYVFFPRTGGYIDNGMSGAVSLALSYGKTMIMPEAMRASLGIPEAACISYESADQLDAAVHSKIKQDDVLAFRDACIEQFKSKWMEAIEVDYTFPRPCVVND